MVAYPLLGHPQPGKASRDPGLPTALQAVAVASSYRGWWLSGSEPGHTLPGTAAPRCNSTVTVVFPGKAALMCQKMCSLCSIMTFNKSLFVENLSPFTLGPLMPNSTPCTPTPQRDCNCPIQRTRCSPFSAWGITPGFPA